MGISLVPDQADFAAEPKQPGGSSTVRQAWLSPRGRERVGELLAKQLWIASGGAAALIVVPAVLGAAKIAELPLVMVVTGMIASAGGGTLIHVITAERFGEGVKSENDGAVH